VLAAGSVPHARTHAARAGFRALVPRPPLAAAQAKG
jgi:hypothetical protein